LTFDQLPVSDETFLCSEKQKTKTHTHTQLQEDAT